MIAQIVLSALIVVALLWITGWFLSACLEDGKHVANTILMLYIAGSLALVSYPAYFLIWVL